MTFNGWIQIALYTAVLALLARPLGGYMTAVFEGRVAFLRPLYYDWPEQVDHTSFLGSVGFRELTRTARGWRRSA